MAGRKPRVLRDEAAGESPMLRSQVRRPAGSPKKPAPSKQPNAGQFTEGNDAHLNSTGNFRHGLSSERGIRIRARAFRDALLNDPHCPGHVFTPAFAAELDAWARREALVSLALDYAEGILEREGLEGLFGLKPGLMRAPSEILHGLEEGAARARTRLGLNPSGYVRIARDYNLSQNTTANALAQMEAAGGEIEQRQALEAGTGTDGA